MLRGPSVIHLQARVIHCWHHSLSKGAPPYTVGLCNKALGQALAPNRNAPDELPVQSLHAGTLLERCLRCTGQLCHDDELLHICDITGGCTALQYSKKYCCICIHALHSWVLEQRVRMYRLQLPAGYLKQLRPEKQTMRKMTKMMMMMRAARASFIFMFCHHILDRSWRPVCWNV